MRRIKAKCATGCLGVALLVLAAACSSASPAQRAGVVQVVAGENTWGNIASQIGGTHASVTSIISNPNADPHLYESSVTDARLVAQAAVVIENGAGYDDFLSKLVSATSHKGRIILSAAQTLGATGSDVNPHLWYDVARVPVVAKSIEEALARQDPGDAPYFAANLDRFDRSLAPLDVVLSQVRTQHPGAPVAYTERVAGYLIAQAGLTNLTPAGFASAIEDGNDPSPHDTAAMLQLMDQRRIDVLLYNTQATSPAAEQVKKEALRQGIPVVGVSETQPPSFPDYQAWQLSQAQMIAAALGTAR